MSMIIPWQDVAEAIPPRARRLTYLGLIVAFVVAQAVSVSYASGGLPDPRWVVVVFAVLKFLAPAALALAAANARPAAAATPAITAAVVNVSTTAPAKVSEAPAGASAGASRRGVRRRRPEVRTPEDR